jgi:hypothetical protein
MDGKVYAMSAQYTPTQRDFNNPFVPKWSTQPIPLDSAGRPLSPEFRTVGDAQTGLLRSEYNLQNNLDTRVLDQARQEALRDPGTMSRWGQMALTQAQNQNAATGAGQLQQAQNQLAMSGGLRSGARERLASQGMQTQLRGNQQALGNIQMQDEANRQKWMQMMPGMDLQAAQYGSTLQDKNISRALTELNAGRAMQQQQYNEGMRAWAADKTAQAASRAGGSSSGIFNDDMPILGGCFLTTACVDAMGMADDCWVLQAARKFRDGFMAETPEKSKEILEYYQTAPTIVEKINRYPDAQKIWKRLFWGYITPFVNEARLGNNEKAYELYQKLIKKAKELAGGVA